MTRKDYVAFAEALLSLRQSVGNDDKALALIDDTCRRAADIFASDNPRFSRGRFMAAAGYLTHPNE
jgi:hypothetical protein